MERTDIDTRLAEKLPLDILVVDDNALNNLLVVKMLQRMGYKADAVINGFEAIEAAQRRSYDIIFMDLQLPEMDGIETSRRILSDNPQSKHPSIIAITANTQNNFRERCFDIGMTEHMTKPVELHAIYNLIVKIGSSLAKSHSQ